MRFIGLICALSVAAGASVALQAQEGGADLTKVAAAKKPVKKKAVKRGPEARQLFGAAKTPAPLAARAIGFYAKGCLAGAAALPIDGPAWQAMRLSRNRNWGHPKLVAARREAGARGEREGRLARAAGRRPVAAARRADAHRPCQPPGRARCRHLADPHARPPPERAGAGGSLRHLHAGGRPGVRRSQRVDGRPRAPPEARRLLPRRGAHFRASGHQESAVRGGRQGHRAAVDAKDPRLLGPPLSFPRAHRLSRGQRQLRGTAAARRR